jgi:hypothetical protein
MTLFSHLDHEDTARMVDAGEKAMLGRYEPQADGPFIPYDTKRPVLGGIACTKLNDAEGFPRGLDDEYLLVEFGLGVSEEKVSEQGQSGASLEWPGMNLVRGLVAAGGIAVVLAQDRNRFAREPAYHYLLRRALEEHGAKIRALNESGDERPEGELTDGILDQLSKFERAKTAASSRQGRLREFGRV